MAAIRTLIVTMSSMLRDIVVTLLAGHTTLDVVATLDSRDRLEERLRAIAPDVILIGLGRNEGDEIGRTLATLVPTAKVIACSSDGRRAFVHMNTRCTALLDVSAKMLIEAILGV